MKYLQEWRDAINCYVLNGLVLCNLDTSSLKVLEVGPENSTSDIIKSQFKNYSTLDQRPDIETTYKFDLCDPNFIQTNSLENSFDVIYCLEVLEHTKTPWIASTNLTTMLKPTGLLFISVPSFLDWHPHGTGLYGDYWRFLPGHIGLLFPKMKVVDAKNYMYNNILLGMNYILKKET